METELKKCTKCGEPKPLGEYPFSRGTAHAWRRGECKTCYTRNNVWRNRFKKYGITREQYDELLRRQNGGCAICGLPEQGTRKSQLCVDHCHQTGRIRGLLCQQHNASLGAFGDDLAGVMQVVEYLRRSRCRRVWSLMGGWERGYGDNR
jgi:hypothetical protein